MKLNKSAFNKRRLALATRRALRTPLYSMSALALASAMVCAPAVAQQAGGIKGKVVGEQGAAVAGVTVTATSNVMPKARTATTSEDGSYNLPLMLPGMYELTFTAQDGTVRKASVEVLLDQTSSVNITLVASDQQAEVITILGSAIVREGNSSLTNSLSEEAIKGLPIGQDYRDLMKLIPGVQYSENATLGPSAGGSGADNKYGFDGVDVSLPLFGNLASEPSTHDVAYMSMDRGGAKAVGFNRAGGFAMNTTSKSGTNEFHGNVEYKFQSASMVSSLKDREETYEEDKKWITASLSGPLIEDELFFYASFYRPEVTRDNKETAYGPVKGYKSERDEYFGKLTWAPTDEILLNVSQRSSEKTITGRSVGAYETDSVSVADKANQDIFTLDGSWLLDDFTTVSFSYGKFELESGSLPDNVLSVVPSFTSGLNISALDQMGYFTVPSLKDDTPENAAYNALAQQLIDQLGYVNDAGVKTGGGGVGGYYQNDNTNFYRDSFELALEHELEWGDTSHALHFGFKWQEAEEELIRTSNGWGSITYAGGLQTFDPNGTAATEDDLPYFFRALTYQMTFDNAGLGLSAIKSIFESYNFEINDTITHGDFTYNIGLLVSKDIYWGQGLKETDANVSGYEISPGNKYKMHTSNWGDLLQPRLGVTWNYAEQNTVFANFARYNPEASSLPRAASFDRSFIGATIEGYFDQDGNPLGFIPRASSGGKFFADDLTPRRIDEFTIGTTQYVTNELVLRGHVRHRKGSHFWEDMPNNARLTTGYPEGTPGVPAGLADLGLYIPDLADIYSGLGLVSNPNTAYVIAEVDGGVTKYWEVSMEAEYFGDDFYLNASYVWSHYYGNFDQDSTTTFNDANNFLGSSNYGDARGRFVWDNKYGNLSGDKPHVFKMYGYYTTNWDANIGAYLLFQSGEAWEEWNGSRYGYATSHVNRYAEPAGSRRSASHWQLDLNYTQDFRLTDDLVLKFRADLFNLFDRQTGYDPNPFSSSETFGEARRFFNPRRLQLSFNVEF